MTQTYASLHCHTDFSNLRLIDSINKVESLIDYAYEIGLAGVAITDHDSISAHHRALKYFKKKYANNERNFQLMLGNEIYLAREDLTETTFERGEPFFHLLLIAKDAIGHRQIRELSSRAWSRGFFRNIMRVFNYPSDLFEIIGADPGHIVMATACLGGYTARKFMEGDYERIENFLAMLSDLLGKDNLYVELQPSDTQEQVNYNTYMIDTYWGKYPFIFTTDAHYLTADDQDIHRIFLNSKSSSDREIDEFYSSAYVMSYDEVGHFFDYIGPDKIEEMANNTLKIMNMCEPYELVQPQVVPKIKYEIIPDDRRVFNKFNLLDYPYLHYYMTTDDLADAYFFKLVATGWKEEQIAAEKELHYLNRLNEELGAIREISLKIELPLSDYFTTMHKMIRIIWEQGDSIVGPSRGSAGGFLTNYLLGITQMNPLEQELDMPAWRFLHPERPGLPDIDIDTEASKRVKVFNKVQEYFRSIGGDLVNICTFGTEGSKSALRTAARGLELDQDIITYLVSMIPNERGFDWTLDQCYFGDLEHTPIAKFKEEIDQYTNLWAVARQIEGLVTRLGVHASGVVAVNESFTTHNSLMKTSKSVIVSAFDLHDSEELGLIKYDFLTVSALDRIRQTLNYLLEDTVIYWQGSLKATYDKYISPKVLDYTTPEMWDMVSKGEINALFQFDTIVGSQAIRKAQPRSLTELAIANSVMRLMSDGELPLEVYARYKANIDEWYSEMAMAGILQPEVKILEKHLLKLSGVADSQESLMMLVMDPKIAAFSMEDANFLRKTIAKKEFREIEVLREMFYKKGFEVESRRQLLDYVWNFQISRQLGYSFSSIHTTGYSLIALQEMNLAYHYPIIYWNCACLSADSSAINEEDFYNLMDEGIVEISNEEDVRKSNKTDYAKVASAIDKFKRLMTISMPDINLSKLGFVPDVENNAILYGLKGITRVTTPVIEEIMAKRPFSSLEDFTSRVIKRTVTKDKVVNLIKAGTFNGIEQADRRTILKRYLLTTADQKKRLTMQNAQMLFEKNLLPEEFAPQKEMFLFTKALRRNRDENKFYYILDDSMDRDLLQDIEVKTMRLDNDRIVEVISSAVWDKRYYEPSMNKVRLYLQKNHDTLLDQLNTTLFKEEWDKYAFGGELQWELDSINFYHTGHPLENVAEAISIPITPLNEVIEGEVEGFFLIKGKEIPRMRLYSIIGTVLDRDTTKGIVTIQTPQGVVSVKIYKDLFALYNHAYVTMDDNGSIIEESSFFDKGTHLMITGILRGDTFIPKTYRNTRIKPILRIVLDENNRFLRLEEKIVEESPYAR